MRALLIESGKDNKRRLIRFDTKQIRAKLKNKAKKEQEVVQMLSQDDKNFLEHLREEMITQDNVGQASPRFWVVMCKHDVITPEEYGGGIKIFNDGEEYSAHDAIENVFFTNGYTKEEKESAIFNYDIEIVDGKYDAGMDALGRFLNQSSEGWNICPVEEQDVIEKNTLFLTLRECEEHIERNRHNLRKPRPYAMTAYRSPQVERLYQILEKTEWLEVGEAVRRASMTQPAETNYERYFGSPEKLVDVMLSRNMVDLSIHINFAQYENGTAPEYLSFRRERDFINWLYQPVSEDK